jgi:adenine phosphoribosyltransferase
LKEKDSMPTTETADHIAVDKIKTAIRDIPDFPKPGILFKDITPVLKDPVLFNQVVDYFHHQLKDKRVQYVVGIESRGFILGAALAYKLGAGFVPVRKKGKLPGLVERHEYDLEYGTDVIEIHTDAIEAGSRVVLIDDLLATGGTCAASLKLLERLNADVVSIMFMIELSFLNGRERLPQTTHIHSMLQF